MSLGEKLQKLRKENMLTQESLAEKLGVSRQAISKWELDETLPDTNKLISISRLFLVSIDYLLLDEFDQSTKKVNNTHESSTKNSDVTIVETSWYKEYLGKWVKIFLNDIGYGGVYQAGVIDIDDKHLLFINQDNELGLLSIKRIRSIMLADIYKRKKAVPNFTINEHKAGHNLLDNFLGKTCEIHVSCQSYITSPGGFYRAVIEKITENNIMIQYSNKRSMIELEELLVIFEK